MAIDKETRRQLADRAKSAKTRSSAFRPDRPTDWRPGQVRNLNAVLGNAFTDIAAWELIATKLEDEHPVETVELNRPPGKTGYVMKIDLGQERPVYVKLQLAGKKVIGRSFHYSELSADYSEESS